MLSPESPEHKRFCRVAPRLSDYLSIGVLAQVYPIAPS